MLEDTSSEVVAPSDHDTSLLLDKGVQHVVETATGDDLSHLAFLHSDAGPVDPLPEDDVMDAPVVLSNLFDPECILYILCYILHIIYYVL